MSEELDGLRKSAIVLLSLGEQRAAEVLRRLGDADAGAADAVRTAMARLGTLRQIAPQLRQQVLEAFCASAGRHDENRPAAEPAAMALPAPPASPAPPAPLALAADGALLETGAEDLYESVRHEHPQTIALVLSNLAPEKAGEVLARLDPHRKVEVIKHIAGIERTSGGVIEQVESGLRQRLRAMMGRTIRSAGVSAVAQILTFADRKIEQEIFIDLELDAPDLAQEIRRVQAIFDDLLVASDADLRAVIEQLDEPTIALALRTAAERLRRKVLSAMPDAAARRIEAELNDGSAVAVSEIEAAQQRVAEVVHRLDAAGEIEVLSSPAPAGAARLEREVV